ncbi:ParA family protein [Lysinibacillus capsici]|uniref:ParA family protein n=2 Tax=Lysinibacillus capsici TaxID=2115968 RepID=UPI002730C447|nr:ParA family protein [Lysinibacillus capsici]MDP1395258.1 ParA family protein [Lysinibacillus capsici]MDP1415724.1 ParA family protein [Lysinibacillus capsici]MDP1431597.1 ParA family protein [Lysinibacillus capsici]
MMKTISIINLKGGVAKTISAINIAHTLVKVHGKKVLLIDNDKQGNTSKFFNLHNYEDKSLADLLTDRDCNIHSVIKSTAYEGLDIIPANMNLLQANKEILLDVARPQQTRLRKALSQLNDEYDYCIIDNAPDINMTVINALVATNDVLVPIKVDKFAFDGLEQLLDQIANVQEFNENIVFKGCFITMYQRNGVNAQGSEYLASSTDYPLFHTVIRKTVKVDETTFVGKPLLDYKKSTAGQDYEKLVKEYLEMC